MAPSETVNPRKRKQPPFNPPRPKANGVSKATPSAKKSNIGSIFKDDNAKKTKSKAQRPRAKPAKERPGVREQEPEEDDDDNEDDDEEDEATGHLLDDEAEDEDDDSDGEEDPEDSDDTSDADMMLAEVTHDAPGDAVAAPPAIPIALLHRLMHHSFKRPDETKLSTDARACVGKYIETFVREGIARCALEVSEKAGAAHSDSAMGNDDGWLEVDDLERVGGQLVLDF